MLYWKGKGHKKLLQLLNTRDKLFAEGIGTLKRIKAKIELSQGATPKSHNARRWHLVSCQTLYGETGPHPSFQWRRNERLMLFACTCRDFKVSITAVQHIVQYEHPCVDDIFASMARGEKLSKTVLAQANIQMEVKSSRKLLTISTYKGLFQYNRLAFGSANGLSVSRYFRYQVLSLSEILYCGNVIDRHNLHKSQAKHQGCASSTKTRKCVTAEVIFRPCQLLS